MVDFDELNRMTPAVLDMCGEDRLLSGHLIGGNRYTHLSTLARIAKIDLLDRGRVADIGCGFGEIPRLWLAINQTLQFWLINGSQAQLDVAPQGTNYAKICCDVEKEIPLGNGSVDLSLFNYSLCQMQHMAYALVEAHRITRLGGTLLLCEPTLDSIHGHWLDDERREKLWSQFETVHTIMEAADQIGWRVNYLQRFEPHIDPKFQKLLDDNNLTHLLAGVSPAVMRFTKEA